MPGFGYDPPLTKADVDAATAQAVATATAGLARASDIPKPATAMPPGVAVDGAVGTGQKFALDNHTHATSVQRIRMTVAASGTPVRWTFAKPYDTGIVPVCNATAENVGGATQPYVVNVSGVPTNTYCDFIVFRAQAQTLGASLTALLGAVISLFGFAPANVVINCQAAKPTQ